MFPVLTIFLAIVSRVSWATRKCFIEDGTQMWGKNWLPGVVWTNSVWHLNKEMNGGFVFSRLFQITAPHTRTHKWGLDWKWRVRRERRARAIRISWAERKEEKRARTFELWYLDAIDVNVVAALKVPVLGSNVGDVLNVHQHATQQLVQLGSGRQRWRRSRGAHHDVTAPVAPMDFGPRLHDARHPL